MKTKSLIRGLFGMLAICLCLTSNAVAVQNDGGEALLAEELRALSTAVDGLAKQMQKQAGSAGKDVTLQKLDIAIAYLNFRSRRIEMFERDLQAARSNRNRLDDVLEQFQREEESLPQTFDANQREAMQRAREELSFRRQVIKDRISRMDEEVILLENRIMEMQSQIDSVESFVQRNLEF
ncbi:MAG: hypothetical protein OEL80_06815 [Desulfuromonadales bacterium]|jgi:predicted  nucleic acid-binding Zn-ribbon protein|nr:hypothetical protein [Desulfuromonadales bacterium]